MIHLIELATILNNKLKYNSLQCELITLQLLYDSILDDLLELSYLEAGTKPDENPDFITVLPTDFSLVLPTSMLVGQSVTIKPTFVPSNTTATGTTCVSSDESILKVKTTGDSHTLTAVSAGEASFTITSTSVPELSYTYTIVIKSTTTTVNNIYYGTIPVSLGLKSFSAITSDMVKQYLTKTASLTLSKTAVEFSGGDLVTVAVPKGKVATKDNGFGTKVEFTSSATDPATGEPIKSNGDVSLTIDDTEYLLYGEFMILSSGTLYIYVN